MPAIGRLARSTHMDKLCYTPQLTWYLVGAGSCRDTFWNLGPRDEVSHRLIDERTFCFCRCTPSLPARLITSRRELSLLMMPQLGTWSDYLGVPDSALKGLSVPKPPPRPYSLRPPISLCRVQLFEFGRSIWVIFRPQAGLPEYISG